MARDISGKNMGGFRVQPIPYNPPDPLDTISRLSALRNAGQQYQMQNLEIQQKQQELKDQQAMTSAMQEWDGKDINSLPGIAVKHGASAKTILGLKTSIIDQQKKMTDLSKDQLSNQAALTDKLLGHIDAIKQGANPQQQAQQIIAEGSHTSLDPQSQQMIQAVASGQLVPNNDQLSIFEKGLTAHSKQVADAFKEREVAAQEMMARARMAAAGNAGAKNEPLPVPQVRFLNKQLEARYQVLNPGQPLPPEFSVQPGASRQDYQDLDKALEQFEKAKGVKAQQDTANEMRREMLDLAKQRETRQENTATRADVRAHDKNYVQPAEAVEKSYQMMDSAYNEYKAAKAQGKTLPTGAESMLALSTHLSTTFGNVKGARITKDMIEHHLGARGIGDSAVVAVQKLTNGDVLSPDQWEAFHKLIKESRDLSWKTAVKEADRKKIPVDFLPEDLKGMTQGSDKPASQPLKIKLPSGREVTIE